MLLGRNSCIKAAIVAVEKLLLDFATASKLITFQIHRRLERGLDMIGEKKAQIEENEDVVIKIKSSHDKPAVEVEVSGIGVAKVQAILILVESIMTSVCEESLTLPVHDYNNLFKMFKGNQQKFEKEWKVDIFFRKQDSTVLITGNTKEDAQSAKESLELKMKDIQMSSIAIPLEKVLFHFWKKKVFGSLVDVSKKHGVRVLELDGSATLCAVVKGRKTAVDTAVQEMNALIKEARDKLAKGKLTIEKGVLPILHSPQFDLPNKISEQFGVAVELPRSGAFITKFC